MNVIDFRACRFENDLPLSGPAATMTHETSRRLPSSVVRLDSGRVATGAGRSVMPRVRRRVYFSGRVQGVGFRFTCQSLARGFEVAGYVRNLPDGRVELVAEGETASSTRF